MMTRKDYVETAKILANYREDISSLRYLDMVYDFSDWFAEDNPNFNETKFLQACGLDIL